MATISATSPVAAFSYTPPASSPVVSKTSNANLPQMAATLAAEAGVVATLGTSSSSSLTYDAAGLLNSFVQAGQLSASTPALTPGANSQSAAQSSLDHGILGTLTSTATSANTLATSSGVYTNSGVVQPSSSTWAGLLKTNPTLASTVITDSINQGIVGTL